MNVARKKRESAIRWKALQRLLQSAKNNTILATLWEEQKKQPYLGSSGLEQDLKPQRCNWGDAQWCKLADF